MFKVVTRQIGGDCPKRPNSEGSRSTALNPDTTKLSSIENHFSHTLSKEIVFQINFLRMSDREITFEPSIKLPKYLKQADLHQTFAHEAK